ncbi:uncharacterized protein CTHT_0007380 [Thermochaetoides thermophila DSM 1495]|uniref:Uncharacterized protein n=1 Tax=Chaetomium thermophilum (strain DSM 1495 / CBS 144.50 / IMI 039719) TaxID=759272 RepID=G0RYP1_CHATD|nr:hypothetical protein CTHT_0007380 [Thermochaetoides thermophila DSM 1495]EGS24027.1 hypothetical protein CTHT_0007380 [Thermochaetoides thermophila DSM 1495]
MPQRPRKPVHRQSKPVKQDGHTDSGTATSSKDALSTSHGTYSKRSKENSILPRPRAILHQNPVPKPSKSGQNTCLHGLIGNYSSRAAANTTNTNSTISNATSSWSNAAVDLPVAHAAQGSKRGNAKADLFCEVSGSVRNKPESGGQNLNNTSLAPLPVTGPQGRRRGKNGKTSKPSSKRERGLEVMQRPQLGQPQNAVGLGLANVRSTIASLLETTASNDQQHKPHLLVTSDLLPTFPDNDQPNAKDQVAGPQTASLPNSKTKRSCGGRKTKQNTHSQHLCNTPNNHKRTSNESKSMSAETGATQNKAPAGASASHKLPVARRPQKRYKSSLEVASVLAAALAAATGAETTARATARGSMHQADKANEDGGSLEGPVCFTPADLLSEHNRRSLKSNQAVTVFPTGLLPPIEFDACPHTSSGYKLDWDEDRDACAALPPITDRKTTRKPVIKSAKKPSFKAKGNTRTKTNGKTNSEPPANTKRKKTAKLTTPEDKETRYLPVNAYLAPSNIDPNQLQATQLASLALQEVIEDPDF